MNVEIPLFILSSLVIFSYVFDMFARKTNIPSILLLLTTGLGLQYAASYLQISTVSINRLLPLLGTVGLILIVLEGALDLKLTKEKKEVIRKSVSSALFILLITTFVVAIIIYFITGAPARTCFVYAIPFSIISSAIAIPSAEVLPSERKEFIVYESTLSDIFGIMLFNFAISNETYGLSSFSKLIGETVIITVLSAIFCLILLYLLSRITHKLKFFLVISVLIMVYAFGKIYHLSSLIIVLAFGLFFNNAATIRIPWFQRIFMYKNFHQDLEQMHTLSGESAFLLRTFFFLIFGLSLDLNLLLDNTVLLTGAAISVTIYITRFIYQKLFVKSATMTELFISPRGLISILLFLSIPAELKISGTVDGAILLVIITTSVVMTFGLMGAKKTDQKIQKIPEE